MITAENCQSRRLHSRQSLSRKGLRGVRDIPVSESTHTYCDTHTLTLQQRCCITDTVLPELIMPLRREIRILQNGPVASIGITLDDGTKRLRRVQTVQTDETGMC